VGCVVEAGDANCMLCKHRGTNCTFLTVAPSKIRRGNPRDPGSPLQKAAQTELVVRPTPPQNTSTSDRSKVIPDQTTLVPGHTYLYSGASSDQDPLLLRHLCFDETNRFGNVNWTVWRVVSSASEPTYFTVSSISCPGHYFAAA
jgi:hypothetical protein